MREAKDNSQTLLAVTVFAASISTKNRGLSYKIYYLSLGTAYGSVKELDLKKEQTSHSDLLDGLRLTLKGYNIKIEDGCIRIKLDYKFKKTIIT